MKKWFNILITTATVAILLTSCSKTTEEFIPDPIQPPLDTNWVNLTAPTAVDAYLNSNARTAAIDSIPNEIGGLREFIPDNVRITLPRYCFIDSATTNATSRIRLEVTVIRPKGELLRNLLSTRSIDSFNINAAFCLDIRAFANNVELAVRPGKKMLVECDDPAYLPNAQMYFGTQGINDLSWYNTTSNVFLSVQPVNSNQFRYRYYTDRTGWSSCGSVIDPGSIAGSKIFVTLPVKFTNVNTRAYIVLQDTKTVIKMNDNVTGKYFMLQRLPVSRPFKIVTVSIINGVYFLGIGDATTTNNLIIQLHPVESSSTGINNFLNSL